MIVWQPTDFAGQMLATMDSNARNLPEALPWIEPSINNLHLEAVFSYLVGNYECSIISTCKLMEHVLRLALTNMNSSGLNRTESILEIDEYKKLSLIIKVAEEKGFMSGCNVAWWDAIAKSIRNKSAHYLLPIIIQKCSTEPELKHYVEAYALPENDTSYCYDTYITDWGAFYHSAGRYLAGKLLQDATEQLRIVIANTNWTGDISWWLSEKEKYEAFFSYDWNIENLKQSFIKAYREW